MNERGSAVVEFVWLTLLLLLPLVYVMVAVFDTQRASYGVAIAGRSAARAYVTSGDVDTGQRRARLAARVVLDDHDISGASIRITCLPSPRDCLTPGSAVRVRVRVVQPLPLTPDALGPRIGGVTVESVHTQTYGRYREAAE